jgi:hypothetical protein
MFAVQSAAVRIRARSMPRAWGDERIVPIDPVSALIAVDDVTLPKLCYLCRHDVGVRGHGEIAAVLGPSLGPTSQPPACASDSRGRALVADARTCRIVSCATRAFMAPSYFHWLVHGLTLDKAPCWQ